MEEVLMWTLHLGGAHTAEKNKQRHTTGTIYTWEGEEEDTETAREVAKIPMTPASPTDETVSERLKLGTFH